MAKYVPREEQLRSSKWTRRRRKTMANMTRRHAAKARYLVESRL